VIYLVLAAALGSGDLIWEEPRYLAQAWYLGQADFAGDDFPSVLNGPGYPLALMPGVLAALPTAALRALNAVFMALAVWFTYRAVEAYAGTRWAAAIAAVAGFHPIFLRVAPRLMTEALALACIAAFTWAFTAYLREARPRRAAVWVAVIALAWLMLTRVMFGPVVEVMGPKRRCCIGWSGGITRRSVSFDF